MHMLLKFRQNDAALYSADALSSEISFLLVRTYYIGSNTYVKKLISTTNKRKIWSAHLFFVKVRLYTHMTHAQHFTVSRHYLSGYLPFFSARTAEIRKHTCTSSHLWLLPTHQNYWSKLPPPLLPFRQDLRKSSLWNWPMSEVPPQPNLSTSSIG